MIVSLIASSTCRLDIPYDVFHDFKVMFRQVNEVTNPTVHISNQGSIYRGKGGGEAFPPKPQVIM